VKRTLRIGIGLLLGLLALFVAGCEQERYGDENPENVTVEYYSYTAYYVDVYAGDAFEERLEPGDWGRYSKRLYPGERINLKFIIWNPAGPSEISTSWDDDYDLYHLNIYNNRVEEF